MRATHRELKPDWPGTIGWCCWRPRVLWLYGVLQCGCGSTRRQQCISCCCGWQAALLEHYRARTQAGGQEQTELAKGQRCYPPPPPQQGSRSRSQVLYSSRTLAPTCCVGHRIAPGRTFCLQRRSIQTIARGLKSLHTHTPARSLQCATGSASLKQCGDARTIVKIDGGAKAGSNKGPRTCSAFGVE